MPAVRSPRALSILCRSETIKGKFVTSLLIPVHSRKISHYYRRAPVGFYEVNDNKANLGADLPMGSNWPMNPVGFSSFLAHSASLPAIGVAGGVSPHRRARQLPPLCMPPPARSKRYAPTTQAPPKLPPGMPAFQPAVRLASSSGSTLLSQASQSSLHSESSVDWRVDRVHSPRLEAALEVAQHRPPPPL